MHTTKLNGISRVFSIGLAGLVLAGAGGCDPDSSGREDSACGEDHCGDSCGECGTPLEIRGVVVADAAPVEVDVLLGEKVIASTKTETDNTYVVSVLARDQSVVWLRASNGSGTTLATMLTDLETLRTRAGDSVLTRAEDINVVLSPLSTLLFAAIETGLGALPTTRSQLVDAELRSRSYASPEYQATMAAILDGITNESDPFPDGFDDTLALARNAYALYDRAWRTTSQTTEAFEVMMSDERLLAELATYPLPGTYSGVAQQAHGFVAPDIDRYELGLLGEGEYESPSNGWRPNIIRTTEWSVDGRFIKVRVDSAYAGLSVDSNTRYVTSHVDGTRESVAALFPDNESLQQQILALPALPDYCGSWITADTSENWLSIVRRGVAVDVTVWHRLLRYETSDWLTCVGLEGPDVEMLELDSSLIAFSRSDGVDFEHLSEADVVGTWVFPLVWQADDLLFFDEVVETITTNALIHFNEDLTAEASGGVLQNPVALTWGIDANGRIAITFPDGSSQTSAVWTRVGHEIGISSTFRSPLGQNATWYAPAIRWDGTPPAVAVANTPGEYWQSRLALSWAPAPNAEGSFHPNSTYGFELSADGSGARIHVRTPEDLELVAWDLQWVTSPDGTVTMRITRDPSGENPCDPSAPDCFVFLSHTWRPLVQLGDWLYVLEARRVNTQWSSALEWDENDERWESNDLPVDVSDLDYHTYPRLNAYRVQTKPIL